MGETKYNTSHHAGATPEARIASSCATPATLTTPNTLSFTALGRREPTQTFITRACMNTVLQIKARVTSTISRGVWCDDPR